MSHSLRFLVLHEQLDELRERKWSELITMQQEQLRLLTQLMKEHVSADGNHPATG
jgi:hypothetical protein